MFSNSYYFNYIKKLNGVSVYLVICVPFLYPLDHLISVFFYIDIPNSTALCDFLNLIIKHVKILYNIFKKGK